MLDSILLLGVGGHGWESLGDFVDTEQNTRFEMFTQTTDWGGFTGVMGRLLEIHNSALNKQLHQKVLPVLPWGDLNKRLVYYMNKKFGQNVGATLDFRSFHIWELKEEFELLSDFLALDQYTINNFHTYLEKFCTYFDSYSSKLSYSSPICLGSIWNQYLFWQIEGIDNWNLYYHQKKILPENIELFFTSSERNVMTGIDLQGEILLGEDQIDTHHTPINPDTLEIQDLAKQNQFFKDSIQSSDLVIIPNGSIANWLPLVNLPEIQQVLIEKSKQKKLILLLNLFHTPSELKAYHYIEYLDSLLIKPIILGPKNLSEKPSIDILDKYEAENKFLNLSSKEDIDHISKFTDQIIFGLDYDLSETFKYNPASVRENILRIIHDK